MFPLSASSILSIPTHSSTFGSKTPDTSTGQSRTYTKVDRFSRLPDSALQLKSEWLAEKEMLSLMQTSKLHHQLGKKFYDDRLKKNVPRSACPARDYRDLEKRIDRYLPTERTGQAYLTGFHIHYPLTASIQAGKMRVNEAFRFVVTQKSAMQKTLEGGCLSERQQQYFSNPLLAEHFLSGRCDSATLIRLAGKSKHLFYSMTLQSLFRSGDLVPHDLEHISPAGQKLLHDPLLCELFLSRLISKDDILQLTQTQYEALLICRPLLKRGTLPVKRVLALQATDLSAMRKAGVLDDLHAGRITLADALAGKVAEPVSPKRSLLRTGSDSTLDLSDIRSLVARTPKKAISAAIDDSDHEWITSFGKTLHLLPVDTIIRYLDAEQCGALGGMEEGVQSLGDDCACAYLQIYIELAQHLNSTDYLRVVEPLLASIFGFLINDSYCFGADYLTIFDQCCKVWTLIRTKCLISGQSIEPLLATVWTELTRGQLGSTISRQSGPFWASFGRLIVVMDLLESERLFDALSRGWDWEWGLQGNEIADLSILSGNQALFSLIDHTEAGSAVLDSVANAIALHKIRYGGFFAF